MATVLLGLAGGLIAGPVGSTAFLIGQAIGGIVGSFADQAIISALTPPMRREGPRLTTTDIQTSTEGSPVNRIYGRARTAGQVIWATRFEEEIVIEKEGGKGFGGPKIETTTYTYYGNFAVGLSEGPVAGIGRIWADGKEVDQSGIEFRVHLGTDDQEVDPLIEAKEGEAPAYRGLCYVVFERLDLTDYGNRLPQITVEVFRPVGDLEPLIEAVALIPGNEHGLDTVAVNTVEGSTRNKHTLAAAADGLAADGAATDFAASIDRLAMLCPSVSHVMLVVAWFGDDLRAGVCTIQPKVENATPTEPNAWQVAGLTRDGAAIVSIVADKPAYGGTPDDASVIRAIRELTARGLEVCYCPFIMMDVPPDNELPNPYSDDAGDTGQPAFPWRGRITCSPAPGYDGSPDQTSGAADQVAAFVGTAGASDFGGSGTTVAYSGPDEWSYRRFILHNAKLAQLAGGVHSFLIGSEMVGLTGVRSSSAAYPFVAALIELAAEVRAIIGSGVELGYAADWSEYHSHRPADGSGDVRFNLDPLWADDEIDFIGIDNYLPLADWRDGSGHLDFDPAGPTTVYDQAYLRSNIEGGEYFDWFYADETARIAQARTPIADGAYGEPWVFRNKAIRDWWENEHNDRPGGVRSGTATAWTPQSKPVRFTEMGCPAVDKGANQPNLFPDRLSSEGGFPWFSTRARDDQMQRSWLQAMIGYYSEPGNNPTSAVYGGPMLDLGRSNVWAWDTRPWPSFPIDRGLWGDWPNWHTGHWISGRMGAAPASETIRAILDEAGFDLYAIEPIPGVVDGVTVGNLVSPRSLLEQLRPAFQFDAAESDGVIKFLARHGRAPVATITADDLVVGPDGPDQPRYRRTRAQETELPDAVKIRYGDQAKEDQPGASEARRSAGRSLRVVEHAPPVIMADIRAREVAELELHAAWVGRERYAFSLPPSFLAIDPGDVVEFQPSGHPIRVETAGETEARRIEAFEVDPLAGAGVDVEPGRGPVSPQPTILPAEAVVVDGPLLRDDDVAHAPYVAALMSPFRSGVALWRSPAEVGFQLDRIVSVPGAIGRTTADFHAGPVWRWDRVNALRVRLKRGHLASATELAVLNGANLLAVENADGEWELVQFATATPDGTRSYVLTDLLRGQKGTEHAKRAPVTAGARIVVLDPVSVGQLAIPGALVGLPLNWRVGAADRGVSDPGVMQSTMTIHGRGRRPLSPVQLRARWEDDGDIHLSWIRRTRIGGDSWEQAEVPLGEESEGYEVEILDGPDVVRTVTGLGAPAWLYQAADQTTDFGARVTSIAFRVYQTSATFGRGVAAEFQSGD